MKGFPDVQKLCIRTPSQTKEVWLGLNSQQTSWDRGRIRRQGARQSRLHRAETATYSGTREDQEFSGGCTGNWEPNPGSDTSTGKIASDFRHHWVITAATIYTSWRPAPGVLSRRPLLLLLEIDDSYRSDFLFCFVRLRLLLCALLRSNQLLSTPTIWPK